MGKTRENILHHALTLFNDEGYFRVTIRNIAQDLGMSSGNLNYHFKTRKEILEALYFTMADVFDQRVVSLPQRHLSFQNIWEDILQSMKVMHQYRFIWVDLVHLVSESERIKNHFEKVLVDRKKGYSYLFEKLITDGWMKAETFTGEYEILADRMINFSNTWLWETYVYSQQPQELPKVAKALILSLYPYLNTKGQNALMKVVAEY